MSYQAEIQKPDIGRVVRLFRIDITPLGGPVYHFTSSYENPTPVKYQNIEYTPIPIEAEGFEITANGMLPQPKLRLSAVNTLASALIHDYRDLVGARVTRLRTLERFLDGKPDADPDAHFPPEIYRIDRKAAHNKVMVEWDLAPAIDQEGTRLPRRQVLRDTCTWRYRIYTGSGFDYSRATCPYTGSNYYDDMGNPTTASNDRCGKRLSDCRLRFGQNAALPFGGFPGVARVR